MTRLYSATESSSGRKVFAQVAPIGCDVGFSYKSTRDEDGTFRIHRLDIFKPTRRPNQKTGKTDEFSEDWLREAAKNGNELAQQFYEAPVHVRHTPKDKSNAEEAPFVGHMTNYRVEPGVDGKPTLFCDVKSIPAEMFADIQRGRFSYRSVEINNPDGPPLISSLAFMATTVPFFKMPNLRVRLEEDANGNGKFWDGDNRRICFAELTHPSGSERLAVVGRFDGQYAPISEPTCATRFVESKRTGRQFFGGMGGLEGLSEDELAELLGGGGGMGGMPEDDGDYGHEMPDDPMAGGLDDYDGMSEEDEVEAEGESDMGALLDAINALNTKMDAVLAQRGGGNDGSMSLGDVPPTTASEPKTNGHRFSENGNGKKPAAKPAHKPAARPVAAITPERFAALEQTVANICFEQERSYFNGLGQIVLDRMAEREFAPKDISQARLYFNQWLDNAMNTVEKFDDINVGQCFSEFVGQDVSQWFAEDEADKDTPPVGTSDSAKKPDDSGIESRINDFCEMHPRLAVHFSEDDPDRANSVDAFTQLEGRWSKMGKAEQNQYGRFEDYAAQAMYRALAAVPATAE